MLKRSKKGNEKEGRKNNTIKRILAVPIFYDLQVYNSVPDPHNQRPPGSGSTWTDTDTFILARNCQLYYLLDPYPNLSIRFRIQEASEYAAPCGSRSKTLQLLKVVSIVGIQIEDQMGKQIFITLKGLF